MKKLSRAKFLKLLLGSTFATTLPLISCQQKSQSNNTQNHEDQSLDPLVDVIVIGAGMSGIKAAFDLTEKGLNVLVLEGRDRLGGRVWTDHRWNIPLDLGGAWIHESKGNPLTKLAQDFQVKTLTFDYDDSTVYDDDGSEMTLEDETYYEEYFADLLTKIENLRDKREKEDQTDISLQQAIDEILTKADLDEEDTQVINFLLNTSIEHEYAGSLEDLSLYYWDQGEGFDGKDLIFPQGYEQLILPLAQKLNIQLNQIVEKIDWQDQIKVTTNQGIFQSKYVVITLPLGVLKSGKVEFNPPLPTAKQEAINRLGMGVLNKVILKFPEVFWDDSLMLNYIAENKGEWGEWINFDPLINQPILLGFNGGTYGMKIEEKSDQDIIKSALKVLSTIYGQIPDPLDYIITRWQKDPFAFGSYSFLKTGATPEDYDLLAQTVDQKLFFAGEATSRDYAATVHGAFLSGKKAAQSIFNQSQSS